MYSQLVTLNPIETTPDFSFDFGDFASTQILVEAITEAGKKMMSEVFGAGAVSVNIPKSKGEDFAIFVQRKGLRVE